MTTYRVDLIESERGWGQRTDETVYFTGPNSKKEAVNYVNEYNSHNTATSVPDWYMYATEPLLVPDEEKIEHDRKIRERAERKVVDKLKGKK